MRLDQFRDPHYQQGEGDYLVLCDYGSPERIVIEGQFHKLTDALDFAARDPNGYASTILVKVVDYEVTENE